MKLNKKKVTTLTTVTLISAFLSACGEQAATETQVGAAKETPVKSFVADVIVTNPSTLARQKQPVYVSYYDLGLANNDPKLAQLQVSLNDQIIDSQAIDQNYDGINDGLLFLSDMSGAQTIHYAINKSATPKTQTKLTQAEISHKVGGEWIAHTKPPRHKPEINYKEYIGGHFKNVTELTPPPYYTDHSNWIRYEGPGIESDKVGYRIYLDWRNGFDIFGKTTTEPTLHKVGVDGYESYHHLADWGMDILKVGSSLGAGGFGLWQDDTLELVANVDKWHAKIASNGDLYSAVQINYLGWQNSVNKQNLTANISMQGGSRLAKVNLALEKDVKNIAAGVVKHKDTEFIQGNIDITSKAYSYIASWGKQSLDGSMLGMAVFFQRGDLTKITEDKKNYLAILKPSGQENQQQVNYYFSATWQLESGITSKEEFINYLEQEAEALTLQPRMQIKSALTAQQTAKALTADVALHWSKALADSELARKSHSYHYAGWDVHRMRKPKFEYDIIGMMPMSYDRLAALTNEERYQGISQEITGSFINEEGKIGRYNASNFNIDNVAPGRTLLTLFKKTGEQKYRIAADTLREQLANQPKTSEGAFWHKKKYTGQLWLDGVYMGMPFLAEYAVMFETGEQQKHTLDEVVNEFVLTRKYLRDVQTGFYYHGWDELKQQSWADKNTGLSSEFWARGMGWLTMAIVDVLDYIPEQNIEQRQQLITLAQEIATDITKAQDPQSGVWWQVLDKPNQPGNYLESSASAMYTYFLAKAINNGYIATDYKEAALKAYQGMLDNFTLVHANGEVSMTNQCYVAGLGFGRDGSYQYYMSEPIYNNDPKGNVPFIFAGLEIQKLLSTQSK